MSPTTWTPNPLFSAAATCCYVGLVLYQLVTIILLDKKFVWIDGAQLMVGYRAKSPLAALSLDRARVEKGLIGERVIIPGRAGDVSLSLALASVTADELLRRLESATKETHRPR